MSCHGGSLAQLPPDTVRWNRLAREGGQAAAPAIAGYAGNVLQLPDMILEFDYRFDTGAGKSRRSCAR